MWSRLTWALVAVATVLLPIDPVAAQSTFSQTDFTGTWHIHTLWKPPTPGLAGTWTIGAITLGENGALKSGSSTLSNGTVVPQTGGSFLLSPGGVFTGLLSNANGSNQGIGTMAPSKDQTWAVVTNRDTAGLASGFTLSSLVKQPSTTFAQADLAGRWRVYALVAPQSGKATST